MKTIIARVKKDGASGPLVAILAKRGIDLIKDKEACETAIANNTLFLAAEKNSQDLCEQRNKLMKPIMKHLRGSFQNLKSILKPTFKAVGGWGATILTSGKIIYPKSTQARVNLLMKMKAKNDSYTTFPSPLQPYLTKNNISLATDATNASLALITQNALKASINNSENLRQERDNGFAKSLIDIHFIGAFLKRLYSGETKKLGIYGYVVVGSKLATKRRTIKIIFGGIKLNKRIAIGDTIENMADADVYLYSGKTINGNPVLLKAGTKWIVAKGFSTISIQNLSSTITAKLAFIPAKKVS
ncbi:MAG: hypothetical protein WCN27_03070 [Alphaproteobacteria bacterium]